MHRIDTPDAVDGHFTDGNPAVGQLGTLVPADWLNDVQDNVAHAIEQAGIALVKGDANQLYAAMLAIAVGVAGAGAGVGSVATTRQILGAGLLAGQGGNLAADRTFTLSRPTASELLAGTRDDVVPTPAGLAALFGAGGAASGTIKLPGGLMLKYGGLDAYMAEGQYTIPFAEPFPNGCMRAFLTPVNSTAGSSRDVWAQLVARAADSLIVYVQWTGANYTDRHLDGIEYLAIGY